VAAMSYTTLRRRGPVPRAVVELVDVAVKEYMAGRDGKEVQAVSASDGTGGADGVTGLPAEDARRST